MARDSQPKHKKYPASEAQLAGAGQEELSGVWLTVQGEGDNLRELPGNPGNDKPNKSINTLPSSKANSRTQTWGMKTL